MRRLHCTRHARFLGNGVDLQRFDLARFSVADRAAIRAELGVGDDTVLVGAVGRLVAEKGYPELFTAMEQLPPSFTLVVVGAADPEKRDSLPPEVVARAEAHGV